VNRVRSSSSCSIFVGHNVLLQSLHEPKLPKLFLFRWWFCRHQGLSLSPSFDCCCSVFGLPPGSCRPDLIYRSDFSSPSHGVGHHLQICNLCSLFSFATRMKPLRSYRFGPAFAWVLACVGAGFTARCSAPPPVVCSISVFSVAVWEARSFVGLECKVVVRSWLSLCLLDLRGLLLDLIFDAVLFVALCS
jgi:hypothetical protein